VRWGRDCDDDARAAIVRTLGNIGADERLAVPFLLEQLVEDRHVVETCQALAKFGARAAAALPCLKTYLKNYRSENRIAAAAALAAIDPSKDTFQCLAPLLRHPEPGVRIAAVEAVGALAATCSVTAPLIAGLSDEDSNVRIVAAGALGQIGPAARAAIPAIAELLDDDRQPVYEAALEALARIEP